MTKQYATARAFREAREARLRQMSRAQHVDIMRLRRIVAFDRALARLFAAPNPPWLVKGGYAFELRLPGRARATRDIDLTIPPSWNSGPDDLGHLHAVRERLRDELARDLGDYFVFRLGDTMANLEGAPYGGARYPVESLMDNRVFATFHLDVGLGDAV